MFVYHKMWKWNVFSTSLVLVGMFAGPGEWYLSHARTVHPHRTIVYHPAKNVSRITSGDKDEIPVATTVGCGIVRQREADQCFLRSLLFGNCDLVWPECYEQMPSFCSDRVGGLECFLHYGYECIDNFRGSRAEIYLRATRSRWQSFCRSERRKQLFVDSVECFTDYSPLPVHFCAIAFMEKFNWLLVRTAAENDTLAAGMCCAATQFSACITERVMGICQELVRGFEEEYFMEVYFKSLIAHLYVRLDEIGIRQCSTHNVTLSCESNELLMPDNGGDSRGSSASSSSSSMGALILERFQYIDSTSDKFRQTSFSFAHLLSLLNMIKYI